MIEVAGLNEDTVDYSFTYQAVCVDSRLGVKHVDVKGGSPGVAGSHKVLEQTQQV